MMFGEKMENLTRSEADKVAKAQGEAVYLKILEKALEVEYLFAPKRGLREGPVLVKGLEISVEGKSDQYSDGPYPVTVEVKYSGKPVFRYTGYTKSEMDIDPATPGTAENVEAYIGGPWIGILDSLHEQAKTERKHEEKADHADALKKEQRETNKVLASFGFTKQEKRLVRK